jgi:hypothetical protein
MKPAWAIAFVLSAGLAEAGSGAAADVRRALLPPTEDGRPERAFLGPAIAAFERHGIDHTTLESIDPGYLCVSPGGAPGRLGTELVFEHIGRMKTVCDGTGSAASRLAFDDGPVFRQTCSGLEQGPAETGTALHCSGWRRVERGK